MACEFCKKELDEYKIYDNFNRIQFNPHYLTIAGDVMQLWNGHEYVGAYSIKFCPKCGDALGEITNEKSDEVKYDYKVLIDSSEFQTNILNYIGTNEFENMFQNTIFSTFSDSQQYKNAIIQGMMIASMLTCKCKPLCVKEKIDK